MPDDNDSTGYKSPPAISPSDAKWGPFSKRKAPLDDLHTCPMCDGRGFINIVNEKEIPPKKNPPKLFPYIDGV